MLATPPELIVLKLEHRHILTHIKVFDFLILIAFSDNWVRVVHHLVQLDSYLILNTDLAGMV